MPLYKPKAPSKSLLNLAVARLQPYPAVFLPTEMGGYDVIFPNFSRLNAWGSDLETARKAARQNLTAELTQLLKEGREAPRPSHPDRLAPDPDEPPGTALYMVEPETEVIAMRLGLKKRERGINLSAIGVFGKK